jgi:hypothetical protein
MRATHLVQVVVHDKTGCGVVAGAESFVLAVAFVLVRAHVFLVSAVPRVVEEKRVPALSAFDKPLHQVRA